MAEAETKAEVEAEEVEGADVAYEEEGEGGDDAADADGDDSEALAKEMEELQKLIESSQATNDELAAAQQAAASEAVLKQRAGWVDPSERDSRSVFVGNVDFSTGPEELKNFFQTCGTIQTAKILMDKYTLKPKG
jgi:polyadenylate-binding protein 2